MSWAQLLLALRRIENASIGATSTNLLQIKLDQVQVYGCIAYTI